MKLFSNNNRLRNPLRAAAGRSVWIVFVAVLILPFAGCGPGDPPELDSTVQDAIEQEDNAIMDAEAEL